LIPSRTIKGTELRSVLINVKHLFGMTKHWATKQEAVDVSDLLSALFLTAFVSPNIAAVSSRLLKAFGCADGTARFQGWWKKP